MSAASRAQRWPQRAAYQTVLPCFAAERTPASARIFMCLFTTENSTRHTSATSVTEHGRPHLTRQDRMSVRVGSESALNSCASRWRSRSACLREAMRGVSGWRIDTGISMPVYTAAASVQCRRRILGNPPRALPTSRVGLRQASGGSRASRTHTDKSPSAIPERFIRPGVTDDLHFPLWMCLRGSQWACAFDSTRLDTLESTPAPRRRLEARPLQKRNGAAGCDGPRRDSLRLRAAAICDSEGVRSPRLIASPEPASADHCKQAEAAHPDRGGQRDHDERVLAGVAAFPDVDDADLAEFAA